MKQNFNEQLPSYTFCFTIILNAKVNCSSQNIQSKNEFQSTLTTANSILQSPKNSNELFYHSWLLFACILYFTFFPDKEIRLSSPLSLRVSFRRLYDSSFQFVDRLIGKERRLERRQSKNEKNEDEIERNVVPSIRSAEVTIDSRSVERFHQWQRWNFADKGKYVIRRIK